MLSRRAELWEWSARKVLTPKVQRSVLASIFFLFGYISFDSRDGIHQKGRTNGSLL